MKALLEMVHGALPHADRDQAAEVSVSVRDEAGQTQGRAVLTLQCKWTS